MHYKQIMKTHIKVCLLIVCCNDKPELDTWHVIRGGVFIISETRRLGHIQRPDITMVFTNRGEHCIMFPSCCHLFIPNPLETMSIKLINSLIESSRPRRPVTECHACVIRRCHERRVTWPCETVSRPLSLRGLCVLFFHSSYLAICLWEPGCWHVLYFKYKESKSLGYQFRLKYRVWNHQALIESG